MAKYMLIAPAFLPDGIYHEASMDSPLIINLPDNVLPSLTWVPLGPTAHKTLLALREKKVSEMIKARIEAGVKPDTAKILSERDIPLVLGVPKGAEAVSDSLRAVHIEPVEKFDPDARMQSIFDKAVQATKPKGAAQEITPQIGNIGKRRASDSEPV